MTLTALFNLYTRIGQLPYYTIGMLIIAPILFLNTLGIFSECYPAITFSDVLLFGIMALWIGISEETMCRGLIMMPMRNNPVIAILVSSVIFGALHLTNALYYPITFVAMQSLWATLLGVIFAILVLVSRSIWPAIAMHAIIDFTAFLGAGTTSPDIVEITSMDIIVEIILISYLVLVSVWIYHRYAADLTVRALPRHHDVSIVGNRVPIVGNTSGVTIVGDNPGVTIVGDKHHGVTIVGK